ncbi:MAG: MGMT family protein, partial [Candidatus Eremiobacteraeota bacterium]|nr:MGMT family protein [Candidatus Eremiobacteraeota bacterium]
MSTFWPGGAHLSDFNRRVYQLVSQVPAGRVVSYGQVARALGKARGARAVGWALSAAPEGSCPWQRVINAQGRVSPRPHAPEQRRLLESEGVEFVDGQVDLGRYGWSFDPGFADHFGAGADFYAKFRPHYPDSLFQWLAELCPGAQCVWDCATGNGQAAVGLARHFPRVIATEPSQAQLAKAPAYPRVVYQRAAA